MRSAKDGNAAAISATLDVGCRDMGNVFAIEGRRAQDGDFRLAPRQRTLIDQSAGERGVAFGYGLQATTALQQALELEGY